MEVKGSDGKDRVGKGWERKVREEKRENINEE
jgi:hypothetical protein